MIMSRTSLTRSLTLVLVTTMLTMLAVTTPSAQSDSAQMAKRLEAMENAMHSLEKQMAELSTLVRATLPPPPFADIPSVQVNIADAAVKGAANARLVLIEFSD